MAVKIEDLLREADDLIEKRASANVEVKQLNDTDEVIKIANLLMQEDDEYEKVANAVVESKQEDFSVKIAHALVINEVLMNLDKFTKIDEFEKKASAQGFSQEQIDEFIIEKML